MQLPVAWAASSYLLPPWHVRGKQALKLLPSSPAVQAIMWLTRDDFPANRMTRTAACLQIHQIEAYRSASLSVLPVLQGLCFDHSLSKWGLIWKIEPQQRIRCSMSLYKSTLEAC